MHVYGLTETYGHVTQCAWNEEWDSLDEEKQNEIKARQGLDIQIPKVLQLWIQKQ